MNSSTYCLLTGKYTTLAEATRKAARTRASRDAVKPKLPVKCKAKTVGAVERDPAKMVFCLECGRRTLSRHLAEKAGWVRAGVIHKKKQAWICYKCQVFKFVRANTKKKDMVCSDTTLKSTSP